MYRLVLLDKRWISTRDIHRQHTQLNWMQTVSMPLHSQHILCLFIIFHSSLRFELHSTNFDVDQLLLPGFIPDFIPSRRRARIIWHCNQYHYWVFSIKCPIITITIIRANKPLLDQYSLAIFIQYISEQLHKQYRSIQWFFKDLFEVALSAI